MDFLLFGQILEIVTAFILVFVLVMLYYFGNIHFIRDLRLAFLGYLLVLIVTLFEDRMFFVAWVELLQYYLLTSSAFFIYQSVLNQEEKFKQKTVIIVCGASLLLAPFVMTTTGTSHLIEGVGYVIFGLTLVVMGVRWIKTDRNLIASTHLVGAGFILFGLHMISFIALQYTGKGLIIGLFIAAGLEAYLACVIVLLNFSYLKERDESNYKRYQDLFNNSSDAILMITDSLIFDCNEKAIEMFGLPKERIIGLTPMDLSVEYQDNGRKSDVYGEELFASAKAVGSTKFEWLHQNDSGESIPCYIALFSTGDNQYGSVIRDMTSQHSYEEEINFHKYYDGLTQLPKRELFIDRLTRYIEEYPKQVALIAFNIDNFSQINDQYGHEYGDQLLVEVAERVKSNFSNGITMTRLGGDQFVVLMDHLSHHNRIYIPIEHIESSFRRPFEIFDELIDVTACMGVAFSEEENNSAMGLLKNVDLALTIAKKGGRSRLEFYSSDGKEEFSRRIAIEKDMRLGIEEEEFIPYYQPIVEPVSGKIVGAEALARWHKKDGEIIYPDVFIPISEETGLINVIGEQILKQACNDCKAVLDSCPDFVMHVNLSAHQLKDMTIVNKIKRTLEATELTARHLEVELTETAFIEDERQVNEILTEIRSLGVQVALDDFGTGYSSLSYLTEMQVDTIKIDRKFVVKLPRDSKAKALIGFLRSLIHNLGYKIVVEGVEEKDQLEFLMDLGCDYIQGYYFYRPMKYEALKELLIRGL